MANRFAHCATVSEVYAAVVGAAKAIVLDMGHLTDAERVAKIRPVLTDAEARMRELGEGAL